MTRGHRLGFGDLLVLGLWAGLAFGLAEGAMLVATRGFPAIHAAHKLPPAALWVAPAVDIVLATALALGLGLAGRVLFGKAGIPAPLGLGVFGVLGFATLVGGPGVLHWAAVGVLALGLAVLGLRLIGARSGRLVRALRRTAWVPPVLVAGLAGLVGLEARVTERSRAASTPAPAAGRAPNVLLLLLDTVRRDRALEPAGPGMPALERFGAGGVTYTNAWANSSWSLPSQATLLTGRLPHQHGADWPGLGLHDSVPTLAERFRAAGYATGAFSSNISWTTPEYLGRGFTRFTVYRLDNVWRRTVAGRRVARALHALGQRQAGRSFDADDTNRQVLGFLDDYRERPFFAFLCYMDVNRAFYDQQLTRPFWAPRSPMREGIAAYDAGLGRLDARVGDLLARLERRGVLDNTIVVVTSDHGESFGDGAADHDPPGHGTSLYPEQARIPLWIVAPGRVPAGTRLGEAVGLVGVARTVLDLAGVGTPAGMAPGLPLDSTGAEGQVVATLDYDRHSARSAVRGLWQYIRHPASANPRDELFNLATDRGARTNLAPGSPRLDPLRSLLAERLGPAAEPRD